MNSKKNKFSTSLPITIFLIFLVVLLAGCRGDEANAPTPGIYKAPTPGAATSPPPTQIPITPTSASATCSNYLTFVEDVNIPDGTEVQPGGQLIKQWKVKNTGECNWHEGYTLQLISGQDFGAPQIMALHPARKGASAIIQITFTAPQDAGEYTSMWQAFDPQGMPFGEAFFIKFVVEREGE